MSSDTTFEFHNNPHSPGANLIFFHLIYLIFLLLVACFYARKILFSIYATQSNSHSWQMFFFILLSSQTRTCWRLPKLEFQAGKMKDTSSEDQGKKSNDIKAKYHNMTKDSSLLDLWCVNVKRCLSNHRKITNHGKTKKVEAMRQSSPSIVLSHR